MDKNYHIAMAWPPGQPWIKITMMPWRGLPASQLIIKNAHRDVGNDQFFEPDWMIIHVMDHPPDGWRYPRGAPGITRGYQYFIPTG
jgi:hypothetical protein